MCADYFMDFTFVRATDAERTSVSRTWDGCSARPGELA